MDYSDSENFVVKIQNDSIGIQIPEEAKFDVNWIDAKYKIVNDIRKYIPGKDIVIKETYKKEEKSEEKTENAPVEKSEEKTEESKEKPKDNVKESQ